MMKSQKVKNKTAILLVATVFALSNLMFFSAMEISSINVNPQEIAPGETATITLDVENTLSSDVENVNLILDFSSLNIPIAPYQGSSEQSIDELGEGDKEDFVFRVIVLPEAASGVYKIPVKITYDLNGTEKTKTSTIGIVVNSPPKISLAVEGALVRGMENEITIRIINDGLSGIKFLSINFQQPSNGRIMSPTYEYIGNLDSDDFDSIDLRVFTNKNSLGTLSIPMTINYKDSTNKDLTKEEIVNVKVYSVDEAKKIGLVEGNNYVIYFAGVLLVLIYLVYRFRKNRRKN